MGQFEAVLLLIITVIPAVVQCCCPYTNGPVWKAKKHLYSDYIPGVTYGPCVSQLNGVPFDMTDNDHGACKEGLLVRHWCINQCRQKCAGWNGNIRCLGTECAGDFPMIKCVCKPGCETPKTNWQVIENTYKVDCLDTQDKWNAEQQHNAEVARQQQLAQQRVEQQRQEQEAARQQQQLAAQRAAEQQRQQQLMQQQAAEAHRRQQEAARQQQLAQQRAAEAAHQQQLAQQRAAEAAQQQEQARQRAAEAAHQQQLAQQRAAEAARQQNAAAQQRAQQELQRQREAQQKAQQELERQRAANEKAKQELLAQQKALDAAKRKLAEQEKAKQAHEAELAKLKQKMQQHAAAPHPRPPHVPQQKSGVRPPVRHAQDPTNCPYFGTAEWHQKQPKYTTYLPGMTNRDCFQNTIGTNYDMSPGGDGHNICAKRGQVIQYWCYKKCNEKCPSTASYPPNNHINCNALRCAGQHSVVQCACKPGCEVAAAVWPDIEKTYKVDCIDKQTTAKHDAPDHCSYFDSPEWKQKEKLYTQYLPGKSSDDCHRDNIETNWDPRDDKTHVCTKLGQSVQHWCYVKCHEKCGDPKNYPGGNAVGCTATRCQGRYPVIECLCTPKCKTDGAVWKLAIEDLYKKDCLDMNKTDSCPYLSSPEFQAKEAMYTNYIHGITNQECHNQNAATPWDKSNGNKNYCEKLGETIQHWCYIQCNAHCGPIHSYQQEHPLRCINDHCEDGKPVIKCECKPGCNTPATKWAQLEDTYKKDCLDKKSGTNCPYFDSKEWKDKEQLYTSYNLEKTNEECHSNNLATPFDKGTAGNNACGRLGEVIQHWCFEECSKHCGGSPANYPKSDRVQCISDHCDGQYPVVNCKCKPECQTPAINWKQVEKSYKKDCLDNKFGTTCPCFATPEWKRKEHLYKDYVLGTTNDDCHQNNLDTPFNRANSGHNVCEKLGQTVQHWCVEKCTEQCGGAPKDYNPSADIRCISDKCDGQYPVIKCQCKPGCEVPPSSWPAVEELYKADCLDKKSATSCPYFASPEWKNKENLYTTYIPGKTNDDCYENNQATKFDMRHLNHNTCSKYGETIMYWCYEQCNEQCGPTKSYGEKDKIRCVSDHCEGDYPVIRCECKPGCRTKATMWDSIENAYKTDCLDKKSGGNCPYFSTPMWEHKKRQHTEYIPGTTNDDCYHNTQATKWQPGHKGHNVCRKLGETVKHWCYEQCNEACGTPKKYPDGIRVKCISDHCEGDYPVIKCQCTPDCDTPTSPWYVVEKAYKEDCLDKQSATKCSYFDSPTWLQKKSLYQDYVPGRTNKACRRQDRKTHFDDTTENNNVCYKRGLAVRHWCYEQCRSECGHPRHYSKDHPIRCISESCQGPHSMISCYCKLECLTKATLWPTIEDTYKSQCLDVLKTVQCAYFASDTWKKKEDRYTNSETYKSDSACAMKIVKKIAAKFDTTSSHSSSCMGHGDTVKNWCYQACKEKCGDPQSYGKDGSIGCKFEKCKGDYPTVSCKCNNECKTSETSWKTIEKSYRKNCMVNISKEDLEEDEDPDSEEAELEDYNYDDDNNNGQPQSQFGGAEETQESHHHHHSSQDETRSRTVIIGGAEPEEPGTSGTRHRPTNHRPVKKDFIEVPSGEEIVEKHTETHHKEQQESQSKKMVVVEEEQH